MSTKLRNSTLSGFVVLIPLIAINAIISYRHLQRLFDNQQQLDHVFEARLALKDTMSLLKDIELGERGYVITGDPSFLAPYQTAATRLDRKLVELQQAASKTWGNWDAADRVTELVWQRRSLAEETVRLRNELGAVEAAAFVATGTGQRQMDLLRQLVEESEQAGEQVEADLALRTNESFETALISVAIATTAALALIALVFMLVRRDVIESRRSAERLEASEARFRRLVDANVMGVYFADLDGRVIDANDAFLEMIDFSRDELTSGAVDWRKLTPPEQWPEDDRALAEIKATGAASPFEKELFRKDGTRVPVMIGCAELQDPAGVCICYAIDLSEREAARHQIENLNSVCMDRIHELETLLEVIPIGIGIAQDPRCQNMTINAAFAQMLGLPRGPGAPLTAVGPPSALGFRVLKDGVEVPAEELPMQVAAATGRAVMDVELDVLRDNAPAIKLLEHVAPLFDAAGKPRGAVGVFVDITDRKKAEDHLRQNADDLHNQQRWLEAILDLLPMPMLLLDTVRTRATFANKAAKELAGGDFPLEAAGLETRGDFYTDLDGNRVAPELMPVARLARGETLSGFEIDWHLPQGVRSLLINADTLPGMYGHEGVSVLLFQDITRLKQIEAELRRTNQAKDALLAMLGHELRNPLAAIASAAELLQLGDPADAEQREAQEILTRHIQHLARLVDDMLDMSRLTRGKLVLKTEVTELSTVIEQAVQTSRLLIDARGHRLELLLSDQPTRLQADTSRLEQVFVNLLVNAAKYTDPGGHITVSTEIQGREVLVRVRDTGVGIAKEMLPRVFDLFAQLNPSPARSEGGLGIGLNIVKGVVELHRGRVAVESEGVGRGTEFQVYLPVCSAAPTQPASSGPDEPAQTPVAPARVLIVEDNPDIARLMASLVNRCGHEPRVAHDGVEALETAREFQPEIALLDIGLPGMSGHELARHLRSEMHLQPLYLVALTGYGQAEDRRRSEEAGFDQHLTKPVSMDMLRGVFRQAREAVASGR